MTIDGFLQFLGLIVAAYALISAVSRYRLRLQGAWLWFPSLVVLAAIIYLLLFDLFGATCLAPWCAPLVLHPSEGLTPNKFAFVIVLLWLLYIAGLSRRSSVGRRQLPVLANLVDRLTAEKRFPELIDFIQPHMPMISRYASRQYAFQRLQDRVRWHGNPYMLVERQDQPAGLVQNTRKIAADWCLNRLKPLAGRFPETSAKEQAALRVLRVLHTNQRLVEFIALERPLFALTLMDVRVHDHDFGDRAFDLMMAHPESQLRRETLLNQNTDRCFYTIDPKNPLIYALFANAHIAEKFEVWRPVGNYPIRLLERDIGSYRQIISASKPYEDQLLHQDATYVMICFFDIMVRSAMRDGLASHMWLLYFDILIDKLLRFMDRDHPDYDTEKEFPNFGYYHIYEIFHVYGEWLQAVKCCPENSPSVQIASTSPHTTEAGIVKWVMVSMARSLRYLIDSPTEDKFVSYIIEVIMRDYKNLIALPNGAKLQEALRNHLIAGNEYRSNAAYGARLKRCYDQIDHCMKYDTRDFESALFAAYP